MVIRVLIVLVILFIPVWILSGFFSRKTVLVDPPVLELQPVLDSGKPVLMIFTASWCGPCKEMKAKVYHSAEVEEVSPAFSWVFVDIDLPENKFLVAKYRVKGVPSYFLEKSDGTLLASLVGGANPVGFRAFLQKAL